MTAEDFLTFYPQFTGFTPAAVLTETLAQANARFGSFGADAAEARRLYTAHRLTLYARTALPESAAAPTMAQLASAGEARQQAVSKKVGEVSVSYASSSSVSTGLADLADTAFGLQLLTLLRLRSGTVYVP